MSLEINAWRAVLFVFCLLHLLNMYHISRAYGSVLGSVAASEKLAHRKEFNRFFSSVLKLAFVGSAILAAQSLTLLLVLPFVLPSTGDRALGVICVVLAFMSLGASLMLVRSVKIIQSEWKRLRFGAQWP